MCKGFSTAVTWNALQPRATEKDWVTSVWFKGAVPRHAFNMWVAHLDRLPTRQCLLSGDRFLLMLVVFVLLLWSPMTIFFCPLSLLRRFGSRFSAVSARDNVSSAPG